MKKALFLLVFIFVLLSCSKDNELSSLLPASQSVEHSQGLNALQSKILELDLEYNNYNKRSILNYWS